MTASQPQGYLAVPTSGKGPGVLVLHAWWGLNETIKALCRRLAGEGYLAFAPDLYHGKVVDTISEAEAAVQALEPLFPQVRAEVRAAAAFLSERVGPDQASLAVIGFSLGAFYALDLSNGDPEHIRRVVAFYGTGTDDFSTSRAEYLCHFAENDPFEPAESVAHVVAALEKAGRPVMSHTYPGTGHWFFEPDRADAFNAEAAQLAWERTLAFLGRPLS